MDCCITLTTAGSEAEADTIASALIAEKLAACVSIHPIKSVYIWQGKVQREQEWQLVIKTQPHKFEAVAAKVKSLHSYDVPELLMLPIEQGSTDYLGWLAEQVNG